MAGEIRAKAGGDRSQISQKARYLKSRWPVAASVCPLPVIMRGVLCVLLVLPVALCFDCTGVSDGVYEAGCKSFVTCKSGVVTLTECPVDKVYNDATGGCADASSVGPPCGTLKDCSNLADGKYADTDQHCHTYYTCAGGTFFGHNYCAGGLVFNEKLQTCDWPNNTDPPCGNKGQQRTTLAPPGR